MNQKQNWQAPNLSLTCPLLQVIYTCEFHVFSPPSLGKPGRYNSFEVETAGGANALGD